MFCSDDRGRRVIHVGADLCARSARHSALIPSSLHPCRPRPLFEWTTLLPSPNTSHPCIFTQQFFRRLLCDSLTASRPSTFGALSRVRGLRDAQRTYACSNEPRTEIVSVGARAGLWTRRKHLNLSSLGSARFLKTVKCRHTVRMAAINM